jgi:hypothetical protein
MMTALRPVLRASLRPTVCLLVGATALLAVPDPASAAGIVGSGSVEDTSSDIAYSGSWAAASSGYDSGRSVATLVTAGYAEVTFRETSVTWVARTADYLGIADVSLDGTKVAAVDLYSPTKQFKQVVYTSPTLSYGTHTLRVERSGSKNAASSGRGIDIDKFVVLDSQGPDTPAGLTASPNGAGAELSWTANTDSDLAGYVVYRAEGTSTSYARLTADPVTATTYRDAALTPGGSYRYQIAAVDTAGNQSRRSSDATVTSTATAVDAGAYENAADAIAYSGTWATASSGYDSGRSVATLASTGYAQIAFKGTSVKWVARQASYLGIANVYLDGTKVSAVDLYAPANRFQQVVYTSPTLSSGTHTLRVERSGSKNEASSGRGIDIDAFVVAGTETPAR